MTAPVVVVANDIVASGGTALTTTGNQSLTILSEEHSCVYAWWAGDGATDFNPAATFNGVSMTRAFYSSGSHRTIALFRINKADLPAAGAYDLVVTWTGAASYAMSAFEVTGVNQLDPDDTAVNTSNNGASNNPQQVVTSAVGDLVLCAVTQNNPTGSNPTMDTGTTIGYANHAQVSLRSGFYPGAASVTADYASDNETWHIVAININAATGLKFFWRCEGTTLDGTHDFSAGDTTASLGSGAAINTDAAKIGTNGLDCPTANDRASFVVAAGDLVDSSEGVMGCWIRMVAFVDNCPILAAQNSAESRHHILLAMEGTDDATGREISLNYRQHLGAETAVTTTDADLAENTWYFVLCRWSDAQGDLRVEVYNDDGSLRASAENLSATVDVPTGVNEFIVGDFGGGANDFHIDNVFIGNRYAEPIEDFINITSFTEYGVEEEPSEGGGGRRALLGVGR